MLNQTIEKLLAMNLHGVVEAIREQTEQIRHYQPLSFEERLQFLVDKEHLKRSDATHQRKRKNARIKSDAMLEHLDFSIPRNLSKSELLTYAEGTWIRDKMNLVITGPTGVGKTFIASVLADKACRSGLNALVIKLADLVSMLLIARADGSFEALRKKLAKLQLLVIDEWLREPLPHAHARELLDLVDERYKCSSTLLVAQVPVADWFSRFDDPTLADAILDRLIHNAHRLELDGQSVRKMGKNT